MKSVPTVDCESVTREWATYILLERGYWKLCAARVKMEEWFGDIEMCVSLRAMSTAALSGSATDRHLDIENL